MTAAIQATERPAGPAPAGADLGRPGGRPGQAPPGPAEVQRRGDGRARRRRRPRARAPRPGPACAAYGINVDLAPVLDVARPERLHRRAGPRLRRRSPAASARRASAFAEGLESEGVAATAKHFPGLGSTSANTDLRPARIPLSAETLRRVDERAVRGLRRRRRRPGDGQLGPLPGARRTGSCPPRSRSGDRHRRAARTGSASRASRSPTRWRRPAPARGGSAGQGRRPGRGRRRRPAALRPLRRRRARRPRPAPGARRRQARPRRRSRPSVDRVLALRGLTVIRDRSTRGSLSADCR